MYKRCIRCKYWIRISVSLFILFPHLFYLEPSSLAPVHCKIGKSILFCAEAFLLCLLRKRGWNTQVFQPSTFPSPSMIRSWTGLVVSEEIIFPYNNHRANFVSCSVFPSSNYRNSGKQVWHLPAVSPFV